MKEMSVLEIRDSTIRPEPDLQTRLIAPARRLQNNIVIGAEVSDIVLRILLFETYILDSARLHEIPHLVSTFGGDGLIELLRRKVLQIRCEPLMVGQIGQTEMLREGRPSLPLCSYAFRYVQIAKYEDFIHRCLQSLHDMPGVKHKSLLRLKRAIVSSLVRVPPGLRDNMQNEMTEELRTNHSLVCAAFRLELSRRFGADAAEIPIEFRFDEIKSGEFRAESDLSPKLNVSTEDMHSIGMATGFAVGTLLQRLAEMRAFSALTGFSDTDVALAQTKLNYVARAIAPDAQERRFHRVLFLSGFPDVRLEWGERVVNVDKLLKVRESDECRLFREWLRSTHHLSDEEVQAQIGGLRARLGSAVDGVAGRVIRFIVSTGAGTRGTLPGAIAGMIDSFIVNKVFPKKGIVSFVSNLYPSIFEYPKELVSPSERLITHTEDYSEQRQRGL